MTVSSSLPSVRVPLRVQLQHTRHTRRWPTSSSSSRRSPRRARTRSSICASISPSVFPTTSIRCASRESRYARGVAAPRPRSEREGGGAAEEEGRRRDRDRPTDRPTCGRRLAGGVWTTIIRGRRGGEHSRAACRRFAGGVSTTIIRGRRGGEHRSNQQNHGSIIRRRNRCIDHDPGHHGRRRAAHGEGGGAVRGHRL